MNLSNYATVLPIVIICYLVGVGCKLCSKIQNKAIPVIVGVIGGIIAIPAMYIMPDFPATDVFTAIAVGILENIKDIGAPVPPFLLPLLKNLKSQVEEVAKTEEKEEE